jgi:hypothetical protein
MFRSCGAGLGENLMPSLAYWRKDARFPDRMEDPDARQRTRLPDLS